MKQNIRKILIALVFVIVLAVIFFRGDQLVELWETIQRGTTLFIVLAILTQLGKYFAQGGAYIECFNTVEESIPFGAAVKLVFGTFFMNTVAPSLNLAGMTLVVDDASKRGIPTGRATSAALLMQVTIDSGFVIIMLIGYGILSLTVGLQPGWLVLGLIAIALVGALVTVMIVGGLKPDLMLKILHPVLSVANKVAKLFKKGPFDDWAYNTIHQFSSAAVLIVRNPKRTAKAFLFSILASTCELACFVCCGLSFGISHPEALVCGYVVATLFAMVSFTPQGVGVVEAAVVLAFTLFGIDQAAGMAQILVYRGIVFWMPFLIGAITIQRTKAFTGAGSKKNKGEETTSPESLSDEIMDDLEASEGMIPEESLSDSEKKLQSRTPLMTPEASMSMASPSSSASSKDA